jgi:hypothetical protein
MSLFDTLKELDEQYGYQELRDGGYWAVLDSESTKPYYPDDGSAPRFRFGWKIDGGDFTGRQVGDFHSWFGDNDKIQNIRRGAATNLIKALALALGDESDVLAEPLAHLQAAKDEDGAVEAFREIAMAVMGIRIPVRLVTNKGGYQNVRYLEKGAAPDVQDPRAMDAVNV